MVSPTYSARRQVSLISSDRLIHTVVRITSTVCSPRSSPFSRIPFIMTCAACWPACLSACLAAYPPPCLAAARRRVEEIDLRAESNVEPGGSSLPRVIALYSNIMLQLYRKANPELTATAGPSCSPMPAMAALGAMVSREESRAEQK